MPLRSHQAQIIQFLSQININQTIEIPFDVFSFMAVKWAAVKAIKNSALVMWVIFALMKSSKDEEWEEAPPFVAHALNFRSPFSAPWLEQFSFFLCDPSTQRLRTRPPLHFLADLLYLQQKQSQEKFLAHPHQKSIEKELFFLPWFSFFFSFLNRAVIRVGNRASHSCMESTFGYIVKLDIASTIELRIILKVPLKKYIFLSFESNLIFTAE